MGDPEKTLAVWVELNKALIVLNQKIEACEKKIKKIPPPNPRNPTQGQTARMQKKADACDKMSAAYKEYAGKVKAVDTRFIDHEVIQLTIAEFEIAEHTNSSYHDLSMAMATQADLGEEGYWEAKLIMLKEVTTQIRTKRNILRVVLCHKYSKEFPTLEETAREGDSDPGSSQAKNKKKDKGEARDPPTARTTRPRPIPTTRKATARGPASTVDFRSRRSWSR